MHRPAAYAFVLCFEGAEYTNAYSNAPSPTQPTYVWIDDDNADWFCFRDGQEVDRSLVRPVLKALQAHPRKLTARLQPVLKVLQGHPEASATKHTSKILDDLDIMHTTNERSIYRRGTMDGKVVFLYRQIDDITVACSNHTVAQGLIVANIACVPFSSSLLSLHGPILLYEDNKATINMVNANRPTERTRQIDILDFTIQQWQQRSDIKRAHIPGTINPADAQTNPLGWILHHRQVRRIMGRALFELPFTKRCLPWDSWDSGTASRCAAFALNDFDVVIGGRCCCTSRGWSSLQIYSLKNTNSKKIGKKPGF
jgi:hypothetical protein